MKVELEVSLFHASTLPEAVGDGLRGSRCLNGSGLRGPASVRGRRADRRGRGLPGPLVGADGRLRGLRDSSDQLVRGARGRKR